MGPEAHGGGPIGARSMGARTPLMHHGAPSGVRGPNPTWLFTPIEKLSFAAGFGTIVEAIRLKLGHDPGRLRMARLERSCYG